MLSLLAPWALFGGLLLAIPIIVHLFQPKRVRQTPFSSLRWLHLTQQRLARRIKWHQILLFLLRAAFIVLLVLALAKPMLHKPGAAGSVERFLVLDVSRSMGSRGEGRPSPIEAAKTAAAGIIARASGGDRTAVLLTGATTQLMSPLTPDAEILLPALSAVQAGVTDTDLSSALDLTRALLHQCRPDARVELFFITDNHQHSWNQAEISAFLKDLPPKAQLRIVDVGVKSPQNAWIADARFLDSPVKDRRTLQVQVRCIGDVGQKRSVWVAGIPGLPENSQTVTLNPGEPELLEFEIPKSVAADGAIARIRLEPADDLPDDDDYLLNLDGSGALRVLLLESDSAQVESRRPGFHLRTAIEALSQSAREPLLLVRKSPTSVSPKDLGDADVVLLADVSDLSDANLAALEARVRSGAGLSIFLGPSAQLPFYNTRLYAALRPREGLLPLPLKAVVQADPASGGLAPLQGMQWNHPLLAGLQDPLLGDLSQTRIRSFYQFDGVLAASDTTLAWIDAATPAIIEHSVGAGRVLLFNLTANDDWSDLPRRKGFLPLVDRMLAHLSASGIRHSFTAGEAVALSIRERQPKETVVIHTPDGKEVAPILSDAHGQTLVRLETPAVPGVYRLERKGAGLKGFSFVVLASRGDSDLTPQDAAVLKKWWEPVDFAVLDAKGPAGGVELKEGRRSLWPALMFAAGLLLLAEMFFVHWLCPRVNPVLARSIVGHRETPQPANS